MRQTVKSYHAARSCASTFGNARHHRQDRLLAIECLDLALLINAEDESSVGRGEVKPDDITDLVDEQRIA